jgi:phenylacetate-CoA ligase
MKPPPPEILCRYFGPQAETPIEHWPPERLRAYQTEAIGEQIAHVYAHNAFYRQKFQRAGVQPADFRTLADLSRFPLTAKDELRGDPWVLLAVPKQEVCLLHTSTGTTGGTWSYILYSWEDMYARDLAPFPRLLMPVDANDIVINALPYEMSSSGQSFQRSLQGAAGALVVPVGKGGFYSDPYKTIRILADLGATVLITTPPYAMLLFEVAQAMSLRPGADLRLRFMWLTGEGCSPAYRRRLEALWKCPALIFYGSMECGSIGTECDRQSGSHVCGGHVYLEIVDPQTGQPQPPGQPGEVVCTVLQRRASPLIRFRTQDLALLDVTDCPCGTRFPKLHLRGRMVEQVRLEGQQKNEPPVSAYLIEEALYSQPEVGNNYQAYVAHDRLVIDAELCSSTGDGEAARQRVLDLLAKRGLKADLEWVEHIPRTGGKSRRIRPLAERKQVMASSSLLRQSGMASVSPPKGGPT